MNSPEKNQPVSALAQFMDRRGFMRNSAKAGAAAGLFLSTSKNAIAQATSGERVLKIGIVGCGSQGQRLLTACKHLPGLQFIAVADIWEYNRRSFVGNCRARGDNPAQYEDLDEMLAKEKDIECVIVASPDFKHAEHTRMALQAGKSVYCEKMMAHNIESAKDMVRAQRETGGLLQIGHQRHSNPRYIHLRERVLKQHKLLGRVTHCYGQWNRGLSQSLPQDMPKNYPIPQEKLDKYGFANGFEFRNWRFFAKYGAGPISDLGAHQIDMFNWFFESAPVSVMATGGVDYYDGLDGRPKLELPDNVMAMYEFKTADGLMRAYYQVMTTSSSQGYFEKLMGVNGTAVISEVQSYNQLYRETHATSWDGHADSVNGELELLVRSPASTFHTFWEKPKPWTRNNGKRSWLDVKGVVAESKAPEVWEIPFYDVPAPHAPHLQNFFTAVRQKNPAILTCPVDMAFRSCVTVLKCYESMKTGSKYVFQPSDFEV